MGPEYGQMLHVPLGVCTYRGKKEQNRKLASLESLTFVG
jgi:hypothetical protein